MMVPFQTESGSESLIEEARVQLEAIPMIRGYANGARQLMDKEDYAQAVPFLDSAIEVSCYVCGSLFMNFLRFAPGTLTCGR